MEDYRIYCCECERELDIDEVHYMADLAYCSDCLDEVTTLCYECGTRIYREHAVGGDDERPLCERCYDDHFTNCDECNRLIRQENAYYDDDNCRTLCNRCVREGPIFSYSYKPEPIFYGEDSNLFIGVELELDDGGQNRRNAKELTDIANFNDRYIYIKADGSLDEGFEIVTHPMTLQFHMEKMPWKELTKEALRMGYRSHKAMTCGLHCHVNRTYFGENYEEQERNIGKVLFLVEKYWEELLRLIATLQMVKRLCEVAVFSSEKELQEMSWWSFISHVTEPELITYLKERQLYMNEPIMMEEEE